jgi:hypothetical protein
MAQEFQHLSTPANERRYDADAIARALEIAGRLQQTHHETWSAAQIEELGTEVGLDPAFVRRALSVLDTPEASAVVGAPAVVALPAARSALTRATIRRSLRDTGVYVAANSGLLALTAALVPGSSPGIGPYIPLILLSTLSPVLACAAIGWRNGSRRLGAATGTAIGCTTVLAILLSVISRAPGGRFDGLLATLAVAMAVGAALGVGGAACRRWYERQPESNTR